MGIFDKIGKKVSDAGQKTIQKTKEMSDTVKLNSGIAEEEKKMNDWYCQIGKLYVSIHSTDFEDEFQELVYAIQESEVKIASYRKQIQNLNGVQCCVSCGAEMQKDAAFCTICGTPMLKDEKSEVSDTEVCTHCGTKIKKGNAFCVCCGTPIAEKKEELGKVCACCGAKVTEGSCFCSECGNPIVQETEKITNSLPHLEEEIGYSNAEETVDIIDSLPLLEEETVDIVDPSTHLEEERIYSNEEDTVELANFEEEIVYPNEENRTEEIVDEQPQNQDIKEIQYCENCGAELEEESYFCVECGTPIVQEMEEIIDS